MKLRKAFIGTAVSLLAVATLTAPTFAARFWVQTTEGDLGGYSTSNECQSANSSSCTRFGSNCGGYDVWLVAYSTELADKTYYRGDTVTIYHKADWDKVCSYKQ